MVTKTDYRRDEVEICLSVMVELMTVLGDFRDSLVLVGGWVPYFLFEDKKEQHTGSLDIDVALDFEEISDKTYRTILQLFEKRGYEQGPQPFIFYRTVNREVGGPVTVEIDFLTAEYGGTGKTHRTQRVQDIRARKARGCDLAFQHSYSVKLQGKMPDGAKNKIAIKVADVIPFLVMKGMVLLSRYKEKDAYDIYFTILHYPGGPLGLAKVFEPLSSNRRVREGLGKIRNGVGDIDASGPVWVVNFLEIDNEEERERVKRDVFERVNVLLDELNIEPFEEGKL